MRVFIASSNDLEQERKDLKILLYDEGFKPVVWENIDHSITEEKFQDRINKEHLTTSDIVIFMVKSKLGKYTIEEFKEAYNNLGKSIKKMFVYFFDTDKNDVDKKELRKILSLQEFLEDKGDLYQEVEGFIELKGHFLEQKKYFDTSSEDRKDTHEKKIIIERIESIPKVCIYTASPLNNPQKDTFNIISKAFKKYKLDVYHKVFNETELSEFRDFEYNFIFAKMNKEKIIMEDDYFMQKSISFDTLEDFIDKDNVILFLDEEVETTEFTIKKNINKEIVNFLYDNFKNNKGHCEIHPHRTELPQDIDDTKFNHFVGRKTDIETVVRKILTIKEEHRILTIKGAGGLGKTTLISKVASEISKRGKYKDGIEFVQCEYVKDYEDLENKITFAFNMANARDFKAQLKRLYEGEDRLIILDNIETLLNLDDIQEIKEFIRFISHYATIVITSREKLNENDYEEVYDLKEFSSDESIELFEKLYTMQKEYDEDQLRIEILEKLLSNNPLAITLVANNLSKGKTTEQIKKELDDNFIEMTTKDLVEMFDRDSDKNIERLGSLFFSINYSYSKITDKQKLALELLSLFPDGIHYDSFRQFYNQKVDKDIKDKDERQKRHQEIVQIKYENFSEKDLKALEDKSLIINNNQHINLQSIIGRFSHFKFQSRKEDEKLAFYKRAYNYNVYLLELLRSNDLSLSNSAHFFDDNKNNFLKCLDYLQYLELEYKKYDFIYNICRRFSENSPNKKIFDRLLNLQMLVLDKKLEKDFFEILLLLLKYYYYDFNSVYIEVSEKFSFKEILQGYNDTKGIERLIKDITLHLYSLEGYQFESVLLSLKNSTLDASLISIGAYDIIIKYMKTNTIKDLFIKYELALNTNNLDVKELKKYISSLYKTQVIEKIQSTYILIKADKSGVKLRSIQNLFITNPFTDGLQTLMLAIKNTKNCSKNMYEEAIKKLTHIKYYHVEAIVKYCEYLKDMKDDDYQHWSDKGKGLAQKHHYRYLLHQLICLESGDIDKEYNENDYPLPEPLDYSSVIKRYGLEGV